MVGQRRANRVVAGRKREVFGLRAGMARVDGPMYEVADLPGGGGGEDCD